RPGARQRYPGGKGAGRWLGLDGPTAAMDTLPLVGRDGEGVVRPERPVMLRPPPSLPHESLRPGARKRYPGGGGVVRWLGRDGATTAIDTLPLVGRVGEG